VQVAQARVRAEAARGSAEHARTIPAAQKTHHVLNPNFFFFITLGLEMSDTKVYEP